MATKAKGGTADATLVSAGFKLGESNVPGDYSDIFNKQYEGLIEFHKEIGKGAGDIAKSSAGLVATTAVATGEVKRKNQEFDEFFKTATDDYSAGLNAESADIYQKGSSQNQSIVDNAETTLEGIKSRISELQSGDPSRKEKKELMKLYQDAEKFRGILVQDRAQSDIDMALFNEDQVDVRNSFGGDSNLQAAHAVLRNPKLNHEALGIRLYRNEDYELMMEYPDAMLKNIYEEKKRKTEFEKAGKDKLTFNTSNYEKGSMFKGELIEFNKKGLRLNEPKTPSLSEDITLPDMEFKPRKTISVNKLSSMITKKDHASNNAANGIIASKAKIKDSKQLMHADFSRLKVPTYDKYYDLFRSKDANINYLATNPLTIGYGNTKRIYKDDLQKNQMLDIAIVNQLGIGSDEFTAQELKDGKISSAELAKHEDTKKIIIEKLTNPQTPSEKLIAASELANYWTGHAEKEFNHNSVPYQENASKKIEAEKARLLAIKNANNGVVSALGKTKLADMFVGGNNSYISETQLETINNIGTSLANRSKITGPDGAYTWDDTKKSYFLADGSVVPNKATMLSWLFKDQTINPTFKESDFFKSIPEWDGSKFVKEGEGEGEGEKVVESAKTVETIKNDIVKQVRLLWLGGSTGVKKINGTWHKSEPVGYSGEIKWVKATQKQIDKINKSYK